MKNQRLVFPIALIGILGVLLSLAGAPQGAKPTPLAFGAGTSINATTFLVAGDSITAAGSHTVSSGHSGDASWIHYVNPESEPASLSWVGGWAMGGAQTGDMRAALHHASANALVLVAGTNDLAHQIGFAEIAANLQAISDIVATDVVLLSSVPPRDDAAIQTTKYNAFLRGLATDRGWLFVDGAAGLRTSEGTFKPGLSEDGVHPTIAGAQILGQAIGDALRNIPAQASGPFEAPNA